MENQLQSVVCILNPDDIRYMNEREYTDILVNCKTPFEIVSLQKQGYQFPEIREKVVYMLNPLEKKEYIYRTETTDENAIAVRINKIEEILSLLGGKNFEIISKSSETKHDIIDVEVAANISAGNNEFSSAEVNNDTKVNRKNNSQVDSIISDSAKWPGRYTKNGYYKALQIAQQYGLDQDPDISSILEERNPCHPNPLERKKYSIYTHLDLESNLQVAEKLQVMIKNKLGIDVDVNVKTSHALTETKTFDFWVEFGKVHKYWLWWIIGGAFVIILGILLLIFGGFV